MIELFVGSLSLLFTKILYFVKNEQKIMSWNFPGHFSLWKIQFIEERRFPSSLMRDTLDFERKFRFVSNAPPQRSSCIRPSSFYINMLCNKYFDFKISAVEFDKISSILFSKNHGSRVWLKHSYPWFLRISETTTDIIASIFDI